MIQIHPLDLRKRLHVFDDVEPDDYYREIPLSEDYPNLSFTLAEIINQPFLLLQKFLDAESFQQIADLQKIKNPNTEWESFVGSEDLFLYYFIRRKQSSDSQILVLVSFGEFQPARYKVHLEGIWQIEGR